jgi:hypothetical protein
MAIVAGVTAAYLATGPGGAAVTSAPALHYRWRTGDLERFIVTTSAHGSLAFPGQTFSFQRVYMRTVAFSVRSVDAAGTVTIDVTSTGTGRDQCTVEPSDGWPCEPLTEPRFQQLRIRADGVVLEGSGIGVLSGGPFFAWLPAVEQFLPPLPTPHPAVGSVWREHVSPTLGTQDGQLQADVDEVLKGSIQDFGQQIPEVSGVMNVPLDVSVDVTRASAVAGTQRPPSRGDPGPQLRFLGGPLVIRQLAEACDELYAVSNDGHYRGQVETVGFDGLPDRVGTLTFDFELALRRFDVIG